MLCIHHLPNTTAVTNTTDSLNSVLLHIPLYCWLHSNQQKKMVLIHESFEVCPTSFVLTHVWLLVWISLFLSTWYRQDIKQNIIVNTFTSSSLQFPISENDRDKLKIHNFHTLKSSRQDTKFFTTKHLKSLKSSFKMASGPAKI